MAGLVDFTNAEEVKEHLNNTEIEFMFGCHKENNQDSCYRLAEFLDTVRKNFTEAGSMYTSCCKKFSNAPCCYKAGQFHMLGKGGLVKSRVEAFKCYHTACSQKNYTDQGKNDTIAAACCNQGMLLAQDTENQESYIDYIKQTDGNDQKFSIVDDVLKSFTRACDLNDGIGCNLLSMYHMDGLQMKVPSNFKLAAKYAEKACDLGNPKACHNLALMYKRGDGVTQSDEKAMEIANRCRELVEGNVALTFGDK
uniref:Cytochrome c oxidase assembly factor 7-like n=1 Tax=Phallusia mammillata TaxID=59560 RepID=A0A6F9DAI6_9ASCI|nr:cytochrome c oxidase assembly factor 7-like [Phallusia mammillata]